MTTECKVQSWADWEEPSRYSIMSQRSCTVSKLDNIKTHGITRSFAHWKYLSDVLADVSERLEGESVRYTLTMIL